MLTYFFGWYSGNVWGNLLASMVWVIPGYFWGRFHVKKLHRRLDTQDKMYALTHKKIKEIHKHLGVGNEH